MATTAPPAEVQLDTYQVRLLVGNQKVVGEPLMGLGLLVDSTTERIVGKAKITQAVMPPGNTIVIDVTGHIEYMGLPPVHRVVSLKGTYAYTLPPPAIGTVQEEFSATLLIEQDKWDGHGSFSYGAHKVDNVPVRPG